MRMGYSRYALEDEQHLFEKRIIRPRFPWFLFISSHESVQHMGFHKDFPHHTSQAFTQRLVCIVGKGWGTLV